MIIMIITELSGRCRQSPIVLGGESQSLGTKDTLSIGPVHTHWSHVFINPVSDIYKLFFFRKKSILYFFCLHLREVTKDTTYLWISLRRQRTKTEHFLFSWTSHVFLQVYYKTRVLKKFAERMKISTKRPTYSNTLPARNAYINPQRKFFSSLMGSSTYKPTVPRWAQRQQFSFANIFMAYIETQSLSKIVSSPTVWKRYMDDIFSLQDISKKPDIVAFSEPANLHYPTIKFTTEIHWDSVFRLSWVQRRKIQRKSYPWCKHTF